MMTTTAGGSINISRQQSDRSPSSREDVVETQARGGEGVLREGEAEAVEAVVVVLAEIVLQRHPFLKAAR